MRLMTWRALSMRPYWAVLRLTLTKMKCTVDIAEDGAQAVAAVKASLTSDRPYSLVLMVRRCRLTLSNPH